MPNRSIIGDAPRRREDARFITGHGAYLDDLRFDGMAHAVVLRSPHAHARIERIDATAARAMPGVLAVLTAADARADGLQPMRPTVEANVQTGEPFAFAPQPLLATDKVRHVGEPVAVVVAETRAQALDAAERIAIDWSPAAGGRPPRRARWRPARRRSPTRCRAMSAWTGTGAMRLPSMPRSPARRMWCRCASTTTASSPIRWSRAARSAATTRQDRYTLHVSSQNIHGNRDATARALGVPPADVRFVAPDVGGGFGAKNFTYAEHRADPVGGEARRPPGEMDRHAQRGLRLRPPGARPPGRGVAGARCGGTVPGAARQPAWRTSAPTWRAAPARCRPTSMCICKAASTQFPPSRCTW